jgi:glycosyltransferase involved in cell wall biosynthesis
MEVKVSQISLEVIIVDDGSADGSLAIAKDLEKKFAEISVMCHEGNSGKGAAVRTGLERATGDFIIIQDADLENNPEDLLYLLEPLLKDDADVVFGSRLLLSGPDRFISLRHYLGNRFLTFLSNLFTGMKITDMGTCYKVFKKELLQGIKIKENRFGVDAEIVARISRSKPRITEKAISYKARTYGEGKKIGFKDGLRITYCIFRYNLFK